MASDSKGSAARIFLTAVVMTSVFAVGIVLGVYVQPRLNPVDSTGEVAIVEHSHEEEEEGEHIALTPQAVANLQLKLGQVERGDYWKSILLPAQVVEIPGKSDLTVSAPVAGIVKRVDVLTGQSLRPGQPLFEIQMTDESLTDAQSELLKNLTAQEVSRSELDRLRPLTQSGAVSGTRSRELEYELKQQIAHQTVLMQELLGRGLPQETIDEIINSRQLATSLIVYVPKYVDADSSQSSSGYSIEAMEVHPGMAVNRGSVLCNVGYHSELYVKGTAFEADLPVLSRIAESDWTIQLESQGEFEGSGQEVGEVKLLRVDNKVSESAQTVNFYARLTNTVMRNQTEDGRSFEQWKFRPGQRLHLRLPVEKWDNQLVLPAAAVVVDGPNVIVFAEHHHPGHAHSHDLSTSPWQKNKASASSDGNSATAVTANEGVELEPVPVKLLHRDDKTVVLADDGQIKSTTLIALNNAQSLYLAMKLQASGGGGHHHDHDH